MMAWAVKLCSAFRSHTDFKGAATAASRVNTKKQGGNRSRTSKAVGLYTNDTRWGNTLGSQIWMKPSGSWKTECYSEVRGEKTCPRTHWVCGCVGKFSPSDGWFRMKWRCEQICLLASKALNDEVEVRAPYCPAGTLCSRYQIRLFLPTEKHNGRLRSQRLKLLKTLISKDRKFIKETNQRAATSGPAHIPERACTHSLIRGECDTDKTELNRTETSAQGLFFV